jgi:hypothetical protein
MIRGRHRGLPIAIDRAVLLPSDLEKHGDDTATATSVDNPNNEFGLRSRATRGGSIGSYAAATAGGLDTVEPLTDEARAERIRQASQIASSDGVGTPKLVERDLTEEPQELESGSSGKSSSRETGSAGEIEMKQLDKGSPIRDRNTPGWQ